MEPGNYLFRSLFYRFPNPSHNAIYGNFKLQHPRPPRPTAPPPTTPGHIFNFLQVIFLVFLEPPWFFVCSIYGNNKLRESKKKKNDSPWKSAFSFHSSRIISDEIFTIDLLPLYTEGTFWRRSWPTTGIYRLGTLKCTAKTLLWTFWSWTPYEDLGTNLFLTSSPPPTPLGGGLRKKNELWSDPVVFQRLLFCWVCWSTLFQQTPGRGYC